MLLSLADVYFLFQGLVWLLLIILLWQLVFTAYDLRKTMRRFSVISEKVEEMVNKPLAMADSIVQTMQDFIEEYQKGKEAKAKKKKLSKGK